MTPLLTTAEAAEVLRVDEQTLKKWRHCGKGPPVVRLGRRVLYRGEDLAVWVAQHTELQPYDR